MIGGVSVWGWFSGSQNQELQWWISVAPSDGSTGGVAGSVNLVTPDQCSVSVRPLVESPVVSFRGEEGSDVKNGFPPK